MIDTQQYRECVVYDRAVDDDEEESYESFIADREWSQFIGAGKQVYRWKPPMTVHLVRSGEGDFTKREYVTAPFAVHQLVDCLRDGLNSLGDEAEGQQLAISVRDRVYLDESAVPDDRRMLMDGVNQFELRSMINDHNSPMHHFLEASAALDGGELVVTVLVRVSVKARTLTLDMATCALTKTKDDYRRIDGFSEHSGAAIARSVVAHIAAIPGEFWSAHRILCVPARALGAWLARVDRTSVPRWRQKVGPPLAVRSEAAIEWEKSTVDHTSIHDLMKIIEQRILKITEDFLEANGVDTSNFKERAMNIINQGVFNMGQMSVNQSAVGNNAQVNQNQVAGQEGAGA